MSTPTELTVALQTGPDDDAEELLVLAQGLREELIALDVEAVRMSGAGELSAGGKSAELSPGAEPPPGAKGAELLAFGGLAVQLAALRTPVLRTVMEATVAWLGRQQARSVKLTIDGDTLEVTGVSSEEQSRLIERWVARHARDD